MAYPLVLVNPKRLASQGLSCLTFPTPPRSHRNNPRRKAWCGSTQNSDECILGLPSLVFFLPRAKHNSTIEEDMFYSVPRTK